MSRARGPSGRVANRVRPATGAAAEPARLEVDEGTRPWRGWRVLVGGGTLTVRDRAHAISLQLGVLVDGRPAALVGQRSAPTWSHVRATAGEAVTIDLAKGGPRDAVIRLVLRAPTEGAMTADVTVTLRADAPTATDHAPRPRVAWEATGAPTGATVVRLDPSGGRPWWLVDAHHACIEPVAHEPGPGDPATLVLRHHVMLSAGQATDVRLRLAESACPRPPVGPDAEAVLGTRDREADAWLGRLADVPPDDRPLARRLAAELLTWEPRSRLTTALDAVALATLDPSRARGLLLDSFAAWAHDPTDPTDPTDRPGTPPLEAWATLRVHDLLVARTGRWDPTFLEEACSRLLATTSWWVDRLDPDGRNVLRAGLPPLDGPRVLPRGVLDHAPGLAHADGTVWLAVHMVAMLRLATTIACLDRTYQDMAVTFLDTVVTMIDALDAVGDGLGMWDEAHGAYLDVARAVDGTFRRVPLRSLVSLVPLLAVTRIPGEALERLPAIADRVDGVLAERPELSGSIIRGHSGRRDRGDVLVSVVNRSRLGWALEHVLDPEGHLSSFGIRSLSRTHRELVRVDMGGAIADVRYRPAGARDADGAPLWQGQVPVTLTLLLADALQAHGGMRGSPLLLQYPTGSGRTMVADEVADDLVGRVLHALRRQAVDEQASVGVDALDAEAGGPARPRGASGRSALALAFLGAPRHTP